jgi:hypothetical protein
MALLVQTRAFLNFLQRNPDVRASVRAAPHKTLVYAGGFFKPIWRELADLKQSNPQIAEKDLLPDVCARVPLPASHPFLNLLEWVQHLDNLVPWKENGFIAWRALSGIYAANAVGAVSFYVGSWNPAEAKVFGSTELPVLARNPNVDANTKNLVAYYQRCLETKQAHIDFGFIAG